MNIGFAGIDSSRLLWHDKNRVGIKSDMALPENRMAA